MSLRIDCHQHYWQPKRGDYGWMPEGDPVLDRPYRPADLEPTLKAHGIDYTVLVQAAPSVHETEYMLGIADASDTVAGVVGWVNSEIREDIQHLERLKNHPKFCGIRPMIQDIPDVDWMLGDNIQWTFDAIVDLDLTFDALGFPQHLPNFLKTLNRYPDMRVVIDHCMKPQIRDSMDGKDGFTAWADGMKALADNTNACCKLSGIITESHENWTLEDIRPFAEHVLECFGPDRVMWGSDWPVCMLRASYDKWLASAQELCKHFSQEEQDRVFGGTAHAFYRLNV